MFVQFIFNISILSNFYFAFCEFENKNISKANREWMITEVWNKKNQQLMNAKNKNLKEKWNKRINEKWWKM